MANRKRSFSDSNSATQQANNRVNGQQNYQDQAAALRARINFFNQLRELRAELEEEFFAQDLGAELLMGNDPIDHQNENNAQLDNKRARTI